jgi:hypothetical protein
MTSRARPLGLRRFKVYLIEGGQPIEADGQILGAQDGGQGRGTGREARAAAILRPRITASLPAIQRTSGERFEIGTKAIVIADGGFRATPSYSALGAAAAVIG